MTSVTGMNIIGLALQAVMRRRGNGIAMSSVKKVVIWYDVSVKVWYSDVVNLICSWLCPCRRL